LELTCLVCGQPGSDLCSPRCRWEAERRIRSNARMIRELADRPRTAQLRSDLIVENGLLSSALMRWRP
jgi:hypothetical protein